MHKNKKMAHEMIASLAKEIAGEFYEEAAKDDDFYKFYPKQKMFINREWHQFIATAKATLAQMLDMPNVPEHQKEQIFDALLKHASLPGNANPRAVHNMIQTTSKGGLERIH